MKTFYMGKETDGPKWVMIESPTGAFCYVTDAEREKTEAVEKARREGEARGRSDVEYSFAGSRSAEIREKIRSDERERIADMLERELNAPDSKDHDAEWNRVTRNALRYAITCIRNPSAHTVREEGTCDDYWKHIAGTCDCGCVDRHFVSSKGICQCSCHGTEPKPLEHIEGEVYTAPYVTNAINALVDRVNDLQRKARA